MNLTFIRWPSPFGSCLYILPSFSITSAIPIIDKNPFLPFGDPSAFTAIRSPTLKFKKYLRALYDFGFSPFSLRYSEISE